jgi:hypothetical protein
LASPVFTGNPTAPTPTAGDNDTSIATTAFVTTAVSALLASPVFTGNPTAPTPTVDDNDTSIATTAFVRAQTRVKVGAISRVLTAATGNVAYTNIGFRPKLVIFIGGVSGTLSHAIGFSDSTTDAGLVINASSGNVISSSAFVLGHTDGVNSHNASVVSFDSDGFTLAWTKTASPTGTLNASYICLGW